ncbi:MAG: glycosyltransferase family 2 protein [Chlamydiales bacterium]|nr:glycosyltransferase family 2 protein [Chlamydiales bacterium]
MISVCILTKNSGKTLRQTLESTRLFAEVVVLDNGSTDDTLAIAASFPHVRIYQEPFIGFGPLRNLAASKASHPWIFALDSDEMISAALLHELQALSLERGFVYSLPRHNFYAGKHITGCGWGKDKVVRLYHREDANYNLVPVHEAVLEQGVQKVSLSSPLLHTPYRSTEEFISKMQHYSSLFADQYQGKRSSSFQKALWKGAFAFLRSYILQKGIFLGKEGFILSVYNGNTTFYKYLKLSERNIELEKTSKNN